MSNFRTHYENLQVLESASIEVIRGAYKHLSQKWHPDKHPNDREHAERVIKIINSAYFVLSNPERRKEYDIRIVEQRKKATEKTDNKTEYTQTSNKKHRYKESKFKKEQYHPWRRFLARNIDLFTSGLATYFLVLIIINSFSPEIAAQLSRFVDNEIIAGFVICILWIPIEAVFLCTIGTTPAKWVFGIFIKKIDGSNLLFSEAIYRAFLVLWKGEWLGIPFFKLIPNYLSYHTLSFSGKTSWDTEVGAIVTHKKWGVLRGISAVLITFLTILTFSILNKANDQINISKKQEKTINSENTKINTYKKVGFKYIQINNVCRESVITAITYWNGSEWESSGWWNVEGNSELNTGLNTQSKEIYIYALSKNHVWQGDDNTGIKRVISYSSFNSTSENTIQGSDTKTVAFTPVDVFETNELNYGFELFCPSIDLLEQPSFAKTKQVEMSYYKMQSLIVNFPKSSGAKLIQIKLALRIHSQDIKLIKKHEAVIRNNMLMVISQSGAKNLLTTEGKNKLRDKLLAVTKKILKKFSANNGLKQIYFTEFVMQ